MQDDTTGTVAEVTEKIEEGQVAETEEVQPQQEVTPSPEGEIESLRTRIKDLEADNRGKSQAITRLSSGRAKERDAQAVAQIEHLNKKLDLLMRQQSGQFNETAGSLEQQALRIDAEYSQKKQALAEAEQYKSHVDESLETIKDILQTAGLDPDSNAPEVLEVQGLFNDALNKGLRMDGVIAKTMKTIKAKVPDREKLKEEIRKELLEESKKSRVLKVEKNAASGGPLRDDEFLARYSRGEEDDHKRAREILKKINQGG